MKKLLALLLVFVLQAEFFLTLADATTTFVKTTGTNTANNCGFGGNASAGVRTITWAFANCIGTFPGNGAGHTVEVFPGLFDESLDQADGIVFPSGTSGNPFTFKANTPETTTLKATGQDFIIRICDRRSFYAIVSNFIFDGAGTNSGGGSISYGCAENSPSDILTINNRIIGGYGINSGITAGTWSVHIDVKNNKFHGWNIANGCYGGNPPNCGYPMYFGASSSTISGNEVWDFDAYGFHLFVNALHGDGDQWPSYLIVKDNYLHGPWGNLQGAAAIVHSRGYGSEIYNNVIADGNRSDCTNAATGGIALDGGANSAKVYNNTVTNTCNGISSYNAQNIDYQNNLLRGNLRDFEPDPVGRDTGRYTSKNSCSVDGVGCDSALTESATAAFVNYGGKDYHLVPGSKAVDAGNNLALSCGTDIAGTVRTGGCDIGAYELFEVPTAPPAKVLELALDEASGLTAIDTSGKGNTGSFTSGTMRVVGKYNRGLLFDGLTNDFAVPDSDSLDATLFTESFWIYRDSALTGIYAGCVTKDTAIFMFCQTPTGGQSLGFVNAGSGFNIVEYNTQLPADTWVYVTGQYDGSSLKIAHNCNVVQSAPASGTIPANANPKYYGTSAIGERFKGMMDEIRSYNYAITLGTSGSQCATDRDNSINAIVSFGTDSMKLVGKSGVAGRSSF